MVSSKSLIIVSDIHVGSKYAVCTEKPERDSDSDYRPSQNQLELLDGWYDCIDNITQKPNALVINGEPIDGANRFNIGDGVWSVEINDQLKDVKKLLNKIRYDKLYFVRGSGYHVTRDGTNYEKTLAEMMGARKYKAVTGTMTYADYEHTFKAYGKHIHFTHHVGYAQWDMYRPTTIARELVKKHFTKTEDGFHTDVIVRSHVHYYVEVRFPHTTGFTCPAWKQPDGFMYRRGEPQLPNVGMMEIIIEPDGKIIVEPHLVEINWRKPVTDL